MTEISRAAQVANSANEVVSVKDFGAVGDGVTDDTSAIQAAFTFSNSENQLLEFPEGVYVYSGTGLVPTNGNIFIEGKGSVTISITSDSYFIDAPSSLSINEVDIKSLTFSGGYGAFISRRIATNTGSFNGRYFRECKFLEYKRNGIVILSEDSPRWRLRSCVFESSEATSVAGFAHAGLLNAGDATQSIFRNCKVGLKLANAQDFKVTDTEYFWKVGGLPSGARYNVWLLPNSSGTNNTSGLLFDGNKFSNEYRTATDYYNVFAAPASSDFEVSLPDLGTTSSDIIQGVSYRDVKIIGNALSENVPFIFTTSEKIRGIEITSPLLMGTPIKRFVESLQTSTANDNMKSVTITDVKARTEAQEVLSNTLELSNNMAGIFSDGEWDIMSAVDSKTTVRVKGGGRESNYVSLFDGPATLLTGNATSTTINDSLGGGDAVEWSNMASGNPTKDLTTVTSGETIFIEFDVKQASGSSLDVLTARLQDTTTQQPVWNRTVKVTSAWTTYRFVTRSTNVSNGLRIQFRREGSDTGGVSIGKVRVYHNREPILDNQTVRDYDFIDSSKGVTLKDRTTDTRYRLFVDSGSLSIEAI